MAIARRLVIPAVLSSAFLVMPMIATAKAQSASQPNDPTIVAIFDAANTWDMETGQLAVDRSHNAQVREFGRTLVRDHRAVRQQGRDLAKSLNVRPTPPRDFAMATDHAKAMRTLRSLRGRAFDRAFLQHEVDYHNAVIGAINNTLMPAIQNPQLKDLVTKVAPAFASHRDMAQNLLNNLK